MKTIGMIGIGMMGHGIASRSKQHLARGTFDQNDPEFIFQLAQLAAQGGLTDKAAFSGFAKMFFLIQRHQIFEIAKIHTARVLPGKWAISMHNIVRRDKSSTCS